MRIIKAVLVAALALVSTQVLAQTQQVRVAVESKGSGQYEAAIYYQPSNGQRTTGLGIRLHYSSSAIKANGTTDLLSGATGLQTQNDTSDHDNNSGTDRFINVAWFDLNSNWPAGLNGEVLLFRFHFALANPAVSREVVLNISKVSSASGYEFVASNYRATLGGSSGGNPGTGTGGNPDLPPEQLISEAIENVQDAQSADEVREAVRTAVESLANKGDLEPTTINQLRELAEMAIRTGLPMLHRFLDTNLDLQLYNWMRLDKYVLRNALDLSPEIVGSWQPDASVVGQTMVGYGLSADQGTRLAGAIAGLQALDTVLLGGRTARDVLLDAMGSSNRIDVDPVTGVVDLDLDRGRERYAGAVTAVRIASELMDEGLHFLPDGSAVFIHDGFAIELSPTAADLPGFIATVEKASYQFEKHDKGVFELILDPGQRFVGTFAYDNLARGQGSCGSITITEPQGSIAEPDYAFTLTCANGATQRVQPFVHDPAFFSMYNTEDNTVVADRNTGYVNIFGTGTAGMFKPGYFVSALTVADQTYLDANRNEAGLAVRVTDVDGDGRLDLLLYSPKGVQPLYAVPPR